MHDRELLDLVRMASEAEGLDAPEAERGAVPMVAGGRRTVLARRVGAGLAAAACLGFAAIWLMPAARPAPVALERPSRPVPVTADSQSPELPARELVRTAPLVPVRLSPHTVSGRVCVLVAIFRDLGGDVHCVRWQPHEPSSAELADVPAAELLDASCRSACAEGPQRMVVVAMCGPYDRLPRSEAAAHALAQCVLESSDAGGLGPATAACLSPEVSVKVESIVLAD